MQQFQNHSLKSYNSFSVDAIADSLLLIEKISELVSLDFDKLAPFYILGEGSNTLFLEDFNGSVVVPQFKGVEISETQDHYFVKVAAGENWHQLVETLLSQDINGLENLALIPGSVGAAPIQNIGAYGVEFSDFCHSVTWFEFATKALKTLNRDDCEFGYRDSVFKRELKGLGLVVEVELKLAKHWHPVLSYGPLGEFAEQGDISPRSVFERVIATRQAKLPDPKMLPNAGSFFKNPVVSEQVFQTLNANYPCMPAYPQPDGKVKLAAGWLIEQAGLKGYRLGACQVHEKQALVLVNHGGSGRELVALANHVKHTVQDKFAIALVPEVRIIDKNGVLTSG